MFEMFEDLIKAMQMGMEGDEDNSLKKAMSEHKDPEHIWEQAENAGLRTQILVLQKAVFGFAEKRELLAEEVERLQGENERLQKKNAKLSRENIGLRRQNKKNIGLLRQRDGEIAELQARISSLYAKLETTHSEVDDDEAADGSSGGENISASSESMSFCTDK